MSQDNRSDLKAIVVSISLLLIMLGVACLVPLLVSAYYEEDVLPFLFVSIVPMILGMAGVNIYRERHIEMQTKQAIIAAALTYLIVSLIGAVPLMYYGLGFVDAFFEAMSAWTTTGLSMYSDVEVLPKGILFWRSYMQWLGGVGIIVLLVSILSTGRASSRLYHAEARRERLKPRLTSTSKLIWWIYTLYTLIGILLLYVAGMPWFDSVNHSMVALATGGFSVKNASFGAYTNFRVELIGALIMFFGGINFFVHYKFLSGDRKALFKDLQVRMMVLFLGIAIVLLWLDSLSLRDSLFQAVSALTNAGLQTINLSGGSDFSKNLLTILMIIGGSAGSTSGAIKIIRVTLVIKLVYWWVKESLMPEHAVISKKLEGVEVTHEVIQEAAVYSLLYIGVVVASSLAFMYMGYDGVDAAFEAASAQGNTGLTAGVTSSSMPFWGKIILIFDMWVGRLEIIPVFVLIQSLFGFKLRAAGEKEA